LVSLAATGLLAQETYFGKNKVRYRDFDWSYIQTRRFDIYFYENAYPTAKFAADVLEAAYREVSEELNYNLQQRVPVFIYNSHNEMQQTNIVSAILPEGIGGFTESFKNRIAVPFTGSYENFRHVLHHELTHAVVNNMLFGNNLASLLSRQRLFNLPNWFAEGYAEYSSRHGWDDNSDMFMRDATINDYLVPPMYLQYNYFAYRQGQAMVKYIVDKYGEDKLHKILQKGKILLTMNKAIEAALGVTMEDFWKEFSKEMKRRYWPTITDLKEADEIGKQLTKAREDGSYFNEKPVYAPDGDKIAFFTDKSDYTEIALLSPYDGKRLRSLVKSQRSGDLESLHAYVSGMSFSPDGKSIVFVAKSKGKESLFFLDVKRADVYQKRRFDFQNLLNPDWSPDGSMIAFSALAGSKRDIYVYHIEADSLTRITNDRYDDIDPSWLRNSSELVFASDHPHPQNAAVDAGEHPYLIAPEVFMPGNFEYGSYNIFRVDLARRQVKPVDVGPGHNRSPKVSPDGDKIAFISNRNGIENIYVGSLDSVDCHAVTNILTGVRYASWSPTGDRIVFSAYFQGAFDIFILEDLVPAGDDGVLTETPFVQGKYDLLERPLSALAAAPEDSTSAPTGEALTPTVEETATETTEEIAETDAGEPELADAGETTEPEDDETSNEIEPVTPETETGIYDDEYVVVGGADELALDSVLQEIKNKGDSSHVSLRREEPTSFDSIPPLLASGEFQINEYKAKLTTDFVGGGFSYDTFFGVRGQTVFVFSDYLGDHQVYVATDLMNSLDQSFVQAYYFNNKKRTSLGVGAFHTKNFYSDSYNFLFSDRFYGIQTFASRPSSTFSRLEVSLAQVFIDRKYYDRAYGDLRENRSTEVTTLDAAYVFDNVVWGYTGPVNGRRFKLSVDVGKNIFDWEEVSFYSTGLDFRKYWHLSRTSSMAIRFSGGASFGRTPKQYFLGGTTNWIGTRTVDAKVYDVENLYFADVVTPLRGQEYYGISGDRYALLNWELRFPMIQYFAMKYPLPLVLSNVGGTIFLDMGAAWHGSHFKGGSSQGGYDHLQDIKTGFGLGMRINLFGFALLRYDVAWQTDWHDVSDKPTSYFSFGADF
jgi:Tol biopolymer transport system component